MSARTPIIRQIAWLATIPQFAALVTAMLAGMWLWPPGGIYLGAAAYLLYSIGSRLTIPRTHRAGVRLTRQQRFAEAIPKFEESLAFFERYAWIDRYRSVVLMSPSAISYREMALSNIAFCYSQIGDGEQA
jgi:hypothetical protein